MAEFMDAERWRRVRELLESVLDFVGDPAARDALLVERCGGDVELLREARELLGADGPHGLTPPEASRVVQAVRDAASRGDASGVGLRAGPYRLERVIGAGGMGVVHLARRVEGDFEQFVAVKLVKRGMDTEEVVQRFQRERSLLASLQHAGIARLFDGGSTEDGRPWLAMEFIDGQPIDRWCDDRRATTQVRLRLFQRVCAAVAFAHRSMVVHRDLKPSNVLVTADGAPKLLDFGLAKLLHGDEHGAAHDLTEIGQRALTPAYASPEQLQGATLTTATDVYSLGLMLYELLCGVRAFEGLTRTADRPAPTRMSTRVGPLQASARGCDVRKLRRQLSGDLETIVATATAESPAARYPTVDALSADIERYLRGLPIEARPASALYRVRKFAGRHRIAVAAAALVATALAVGWISVWRAYRTAELARASESRERERAESREAEAERAAARANAALSIVHEIFETAGEPTAERSEVTVRELLEGFDARWRGRAATDPQVEAAVRETVGAAYLGLGAAERAREQFERVIELGATSNLDPLLMLRAKSGMVRVKASRAEYDDALQAAVELDQEWSALPNAPIDVRLQGFMQQAQIHAQMGRFDRAREAARSALDLARSSLASDSRAQVGALAILGQCSAKSSDFTRAESELREALELHRASGRPDTLGTAAIRNELAGVLLQSAQFDEAQALLESAVELRRRLTDERSVDVGESLGLLGRTLSERGDPQRAAPLLEESLEIALASLPRVHPNVATAMSRLAEVKRVLRERDEALRLFRDALEIRRQLYGDDHPVTARSMGNLGLALLEAGDLDGADALLRSAIEARRKLGGDPAGLAANLQSLGSVEGRRGRLEERLTLEREAIALLRALDPPDPAALAHVLMNHADALQSAGRARESLPLAVEATELRRTVFGEGSARHARALSDLGAAQLAAGDYADALATLKDSLGRQRSVLDAHDPELALTLERTASTLRFQSRMSESVPYWREALEILDASLGRTHSRTRRVETRFAQTLREIGDEAQAREVETRP